MPPVFLDNAACTNDLLTLNNYSITYNDAAPLTAALTFTPNPPVITTGVAGTTYGPVLARWQTNTGEYQTTAGTITWNDTTAGTWVVGDEGTYKLTVNDPVTLNYYYPPDGATFTVPATGELMYWATAVPDKRERFRNNFLIKSRAREALKHATHAEAKARATLRDMLSEAEWRRYLTNGFIMVKGNSGRWYQIFNQYHRRVGVFQANKKIADICIHSDTSCPPTDHVINMKLLAELDEDAIWKGGNIHRQDGGDLLTVTGRLVA